MLKIRNLTYLVLILWFSMAGIRGNPAAAAVRPIYVVRDWQAYLRLVPVSVRTGYTPLLYNQEAALTPAIRHFAELYGGIPLAFDAEGVQQLVATTWPQAETIVVAERQSRLGMLAAAIAATLDSPLFFALPTEAELRGLQVQQVIAVGEVTLPAQIESVTLRDLAEAQQYYNDLVGERPVAVLATETSNEFLAAGVAAYHRGTLLLSLAEIQAHQPRYLAWVTTPRSVTRQKVYALYEACRFSPGSEVYDVNVGILTGLTPHDVALLLARTYAYHELEGEWKTRAVIANPEAAATSQLPPVDPLVVTPLSGKALTGETFLEDIRGAGYVWVLAHGSPSSLTLPDGRWPGRRSITGLPPLVFVAESCKTGDITGEGADNSVALRVIAGGAVAYIGSMDMGGVGLIGRYPYARSSPSTPLGALVRLQTAARMDVDADTPRVILIGDPTFHQFEHEWLHYEVFPENGSVRVHVQEQIAVGPVVVAFELPNGMSVQYAQTHQTKGQNTSYMPGIVYSPQTLAKVLGFEVPLKPLSSALTFGRRTILLEWAGNDGELILSSQPSLKAQLHRVISDMLAGIQGIFIDLLAQPVFSGPLAIVNGLILRHIWINRKRTLAMSTRWAGVFAGIGMSLLGLVSLGGSLAHSWLVIALLGCWALTVLWLLAPRWREWKRMAQCAGLYIAPLMLILPFVVVMGMSQRGLLLVIWGITLTGLAYGFVLLAAITLAAKVIRT